MEIAKLTACIGDLLIAASHEALICAALYSATI
jgi:hypothetical protein